MPRKPTGRPTGRPPGSGKLGDHTRMTVRIPRALYERLDTYAAGRSFTRGTPQLALCVREALEVYLDSKRQTKSVPVISMESKSQPESGTAPTWDEIRQPESILHLHGDTLQQTKNVPKLSAETIEHNIRQTENKQVSPPPRPLDAADLGARPVAPVAMVQQPAPALQEPAYDPQTDVLGPLCEHGHDYQGTGQSLRRKSDNECRQCRRDRNAAYKARKRQAAPVA